MDREDNYKELSEAGDVENSITAPKTKYPYSVFFIVSNEFCERFCFYGMRSILTLYMVNILLYSKADATVIYHTFIMMVYFFPLIGAIISDSFLGKFRTIFYVSIIYAAGSIILSISSIPSLNLPMRESSILGLALIAIGTGGIKPCVSAFGGDQFVLPEQATLLAMFFSLFYFSINAGSLLSTFLTPVLREDVHCFGNTSCYPLAFGVPGLLMIIAIVIFGLGKPLYKIKQPEGNVVLKVMKCIGNAIKTKASSTEKKEHWLDHSSIKYGQHFVDDIKATLKVLILYLPLPIFWALYDQQGTAWTFQAVRMDGNIGFYTILPDQFQLINPLLIMAFIPIFQYIVYPVFQKLGMLRTPLEKMTWGGFLAALAFAVSAFVSIQIESTDPVLPGEGFAQVRFYNPLPCDIVITKTEPCSLKEDLNGLVKRMDYVEILDLKMRHALERNVTINFEAECTKEKSQTMTFLVQSKTTMLAYFTYDGLVARYDDITKDDDTGSPYLRTLMSKASTEKLYYVSFLNGESELQTVNNTFTDRLKISAGSYRVFRTDQIKSNSSMNNTDHLMQLTKTANDIEIDLRLGGVYTLMIEVGENDEIMSGKLVTVTESNSISMLWLLLQYIIITAAEILFSITGLEFSYSQAPVSMKSVLTASFLLTDSIGNLLVVVIEAAKFSDRASYNFFFYTGLMIVDMLVFWFLARNYKYVDFEESEEQMKLDNDNNFVQSKQDMCLENPVFIKNQDD
ncbi:peptide transporter family 1-like isoform X2 [Coccinella septempunctata]|uniref:peptide transporter family 1-like isoform X2 n=1 Tax=Coccinella septempunctata TaxID=41139 RepID=UPI001D069A94|nr:peptide transporter family 1-like isoform X2 [Coccinella septempunctata]